MKIAPYDTRTRPQDQLSACSRTLKFGRRHHCQFSKTNPRLWRAHINLNIWKHLEKAVPVYVVFNYNIGLEVFSNNLHVLSLYSGVVCSTSTLLMQAGLMEPVVTGGGPEDLEFFLTATKSLFWIVNGDLYKIPGPALYQQLNFGWISVITTCSFFVCVYKNEKGNEPTTMGFVLSTYCKINIWAVTIKSEFGRKSDHD